MRTLNDYFLTSKITDISTAGSTFVPVPDDGRIIKIFTSIKMLLLQLMLHYHLKLVELL
jgi:hypothetical protein